MIRYFFLYEKVICNITIIYYRYYHNNLQICYSEIAVALKCWRDREFFPAHCPPYLNLASVHSIFRICR